MLLSLRESDRGAKPQPLKVRPPQGGLLKGLLLFVYALLYGTRFFGSARIVGAGGGVCARSAGVTAG